MLASARRGPGQGSLVNPVPASIPLGTRSVGWTDLLEEEEALVRSFSPLLVRKGLQPVTRGLPGVRPVASPCEWSGELALAI